MNRLPWISTAVLYALFAGNLGCHPSADRTAAPNLTCPALAPISGISQREAFAAEVQAAGYGLDSRSEWTWSHNASTANEVIPPATAVDKLVQDLANAHLAERRPLRYEQALNDCQHRAHLAAAYILDQRPEWLVGKVLVQGDHQLGMSHNMIRWGFHIAPMVVASDDGKTVLLVLDPAVDDTRALPLREWLTVIHRKNAQTPKPIAAFLPADRWQPDESDQTFCAEVKSARQSLQDFGSAYDGHRRFKREHLRANVRVTDLDSRRQLVCFVHTNWFHYPQSLHDALQSAKKGDREITIHYRKVRLGKYKRGHYLHIHKIDGTSAAPVTAPTVEAVAPAVTPRSRIERSWDALAAGVSADTANRAGKPGKPDPPVGATEPGDSASLDATSGAASPRPAIAPSPRTEEARR